MPVRTAFSQRSLSLALLSLTLGTAATLQSPVAYAQAASASVTGFVVDPDQAAIPGAVVTLTPARGTALTTTSGGDGGFSFRNVPAGVYSLTVTMNGFASFVRQNIRVGATSMAINAQMTIQTQSQEVNVTTENTTQVSVDPDSNGSSTVIKDKDLDALSDDPDELSSELAALAGPTAGPNGGQIYVDGFTGGQLPPKSSIREIRINQNPFSAQFDKQGFGRVEIFTKPGTDSFHGNASLQGNDKSFNTSSPFLGSANQQPDYHRIFFLGSLTGPLTKTSSFSLAGSYRVIQDNSIFAGTDIVTTGPGSSVLCAPGTPTCALYAFPDTARATFHPQTRYDMTPRVDLALGKSNTLTIRYQFEHNMQTNAGLGATSLATVANNNTSWENNIQISDTQILSQKVINETRLQLVRANTDSTPVSTAAAVTVAGYFTGGGSGGGPTTSTADHLEFQNYTSVALQKNFIRAGMRLRYFRTAENSTSGSSGTFSYNNTTDYIKGNAAQYSVNVYAHPQISANLVDIGLYAEDDWRVKPNMTVSYGMRYEAQTDVNSKADIAPRVAVSYGIPRKKGNPTSVLRAGWGIFYDRFVIGDVLNAFQQNGTNSIENIYRAKTAGGNIPGCGPSSVAACAAGSASGSAGTIYQLSPNLRSSYNMQGTVGLDQQVGRRTTISFNYLTNTGVHQFLSRSLPVNGSYANGVLYSYQSGGIYHQNQFFVNVRTQLSTKFSVSGYYALNFAKSNANGADSFPTDSLNTHTDYGEALFVQRNRIFLSGNWSAKYGFNFSPLLNFSTGSFYNITTGTDLNGDSIRNDRAGFVNGVSGNCRDATTFTAVGVTAANRVSPGYCQGPPNVQFNLRAVKVFGFGAQRGAPAGGGGGGRGFGGPGGPGGGGGRGGAGGGGGAPRGGLSSGRKYTLNIGAQIQNLFNFVPYSTPNGSLAAYNADPTKNLFGKSTSLTGGGPGGSTAAVRTITLQATFNF
jgi:hypothetical protein